MNRNAKLLNARQNTIVISVFFTVLTILIGFFSPTLVSFSSENANLMWAAFIVGLCVLGAIINLRVGVFLFIAASFFSGILNRLSYSISPVDIQFLIVLPEIGLFFVWGITLLNIMTKKRVPSSYFLDISVLMYIGLGILQIFNPMIPLSVGLYGFQVNIIIVFAFFLPRFVFFRWVHVKQFYRLLLFLSVLYLIYGIVQQLGFLPGFEQIWLEKSGVINQLEDSYNNQMGYYIDGKLRVFSIFSVNGEFTYVASLVGLIVWGAKRYSVERWEKLLRWLSLGLLFLFFAISLERTSIAMFIAGVVIMYVVNNPGTAKRPNVRLVFLAVAIVIFFLLGSIILPNISTGNVALDRLAELLNPLHAKTVKDFRFQVWQNAVNLIIRNPLGYGLGTATETRTSIATGSYLIGPHNYFLRIGIELGVVGLLIFVTIMGMLVKLQIEYLSVIKKNSALFDWVRSLLGVQAAVLVCGLISIPLLHAVGVLYWFLMGMTPVVIARLHNDFNRQNV